MNSTNQNQYPLVITMWETYGSNMEAIAAGVAKELGLKLHKQAYSSEDIEAAQARREKDGILAMFFRNLTPYAESAVGDPVRTVALATATYRDMAEQNTEVVRQEAAEGGVIMGRNGQFLLSRRPNTLHVKLDGPVSARIARGAQASGISEDRAASRQVIEDDFRANMSLRTYGFDPRDNDYYDLVLNGAAMSPDQCVSLIVAAVKGMRG